MVSPPKRTDTLRHPSHARRKARRYAVQAIYQWQVGGDNLANIERQFHEDYGFKADEIEYFRELLHGVPAELDAVDAALQPALDRGLDEVDPVERAILRIAAYELLKRLDVPYQVVINEAVNLTKTFGAEQGHRFVNGVLDQAARRLRAPEVAAGGRRPD